MLQRLSNLCQVPSPHRQQLLSEIQSGQTLGKATGESLVPVSSLLFISAGEPFAAHVPALKQEHFPGGERRDLLWEKWPEQSCTIPGGSGEPQPS